MLNFIKYLNFHSHFCVKFASNNYSFFSPFLASLQHNRIIKNVYTTFRIRKKFFEREAFTFHFKKAQGRQRWSIKFHNIFFYLFDAISNTLLFPFHSQPLFIHFSLTIDLNISICVNFRWKMMLIKREKIFQSLFELYVWKFFHFSFGEKLRKYFSFYSLFLRALQKNW